MDYNGEVLSGVKVHLDGNSYTNCRFVRCEIIFSAVEGVGLMNCEFEDCSWSMSGPASRTVHFLSAMYNGVGGGARELIERTFQNIREGSYGDSSSERVRVVTKPTIFVGHGGSKDYLELTNFLHERGYSVETFESESRSGITAKEVVESMAMRASMAFLIHSSEDEQSNGAVRARQNVVHETGLFQGRLGFRRAIVVRENGCEPFSNLSGVQEIRYQSGQIRDKFLDVLNVIEREYPAG